MSEWRASTFGALVAERILEIGDGYRAKLEELGGNGPIFLRAGLLTERRIEWAGADRFREERTQQIRSKLGRPGDTVITTKGNSIGRAGYVPESAPSFVYSPHLSYWRSLDRTQLASGFLRYWSRGPEFLNQLQAMASSTDMAPYLSLVDQRRLQISIPNIEIQKAIAATLGVLDDKIAVNDRIADICHTLAEQYYQEATVDLPEVPLSSVVKPILGGTPDRAVAAYWGPGNPWASAKDVVGSRFGILIDTEEEITKLAVTETKAKPVPKGTVILTARGTVGIVARCGQPTSFNQSCYAFTPTHLPSAVLYLTMRWAAKRMLSVAHGTVFSTVTMKTFDHIFVPSIRQLELGALENRTAPLLALIECCVRESGGLARLRDELLPRLLTGEIRVQAAEEMVAEVT